MSKLNSLDRITIASPCNADWDSMIGTDQVRFCAHCQLQVNDLSAMNRHEAERLVARSQGRLCVRYIQRPDGRVLTQVPQTLHRIGRRVSRIAAGVFTATLSLSTAAAQTRPSSSAHQSPEIAELIQLNGERKIVVDEFTASVTGTIKTSEGALVADATVVLVDRETGEERNTTSSDRGAYAFQLLQAADYLLWVRKPGFETEREKVPVPANSNVQIEITIKEPSRISMMGAVMMSIEPVDPLVKAVSDSRYRSGKKARLYESRPKCSQPAGNAPAA